MKLHPPSASESGPVWLERIAELRERCLQRVRVSRATERNVYSVRALTPDTRYITARGEVPRLLRAMTDLSRGLSNAPGIVLVTYRSDPQEWAHGAVGRAKVLETLLSIGDLAGRGFFDLAIHCGGQQLVLTLDRHGILEIRGASWNLPLMRAALDGAGLSEEARVSPVADARPPVSWGDREAARVETILTQLGLEPVVEG